MIPDTTDQGDDDAHDPQTNIFDTIMVTSLGKSHVRIHTQYQQNRVHYLV